MVNALLVLTMFGTVQLPGTPAGKKLEAWVTAVNSGNRAKIDAVHVGERDAARHASEDASIAERTGGLDLHSVERATPTEIVAIARTKLTEGWLRIELAVDSTPPHAIASRSRRSTAATRAPPPGCSSACWPDTASPPP